MKAIRNGRENPLTITVTVFFLSGTRAGTECRTGKRNRYYGRSGTKHFDWERVDFDWESVFQIGNADACNPFKYLVQHNRYKHA
jgi:hypothetical protein